MFNNVIHNFHLNPLMMWFSVFMILYGLVQFVLSFNRRYKKPNWLALITTLAVALAIICWQRTILIPLDCAFLIAIYLDAIITIEIERHDLDIFFFPPEERAGGIGSKDSAY